MLIVSLCLAGPALLMVWKQWIEPNWGTVDTVVAARAIERGEKLASNDLKAVRLPRESVVLGALTRLEEAEGMEVTRSLRVNEQLTPEDIDASGLVPGQGEWNMPLPAEWIFGKPPGSLLRGDQVTLLPVPKNEAGKLHETAELGESVLTAAAAGVTVDEALTGITVSFVKGSNNEEIAADEERKRPTGSVSGVELIVNEHQKETIRQYGIEGYRFLIIYR